MADESLFKHETAIVESSSVGAGTRVWAFAHILPGAAIGADCNICDQTFIENDVRIGDRVTIKCGVQVWDGITLEDDVFVGPNATFSNDPFPRSGQRPASLCPHPRQTRRVHRRQCYHAPRTHHRGTGHGGRRLGGHT